MSLNTKKIREFLFFHLLSESVSFVVNKNIKLPQSLSAAVLIFLCCSFNYGQVTKEKYDKAVDFFNCKIVEKSLDEYAKSVSQNSKPTAQQTYDRFQMESQNCQNIDYKGIQQFLDLIGIYSDTKKLSIEINGLRQKYRDEKSADELITFIADESFRDNYTFPLLSTFANKSRRVNDFAEFRQQLKTSLKTIIEANGQPLKTPDNTNVPTPSSKPPEVSKDDSSWFSFVKLISLLNILVLIAGFVVFGLGYSYVLRRIKDADNSNIVRSSTAKFKKKSDEALETSFMMSAQIKLLQNRMDEYEKSLNFFKTSIQEPQPLPITGKENSNHSATDKAATRSYIEIIYFPMSKNDGSFSDNDKHFPFKAGRSVYKFSKTSDNEADFEIDSHEEAIQLAFNYLERIIGSVCVSTNKPSQTRRRIVTIQPGTVVLRSGKWEINEMAVIRFDSTASSPANPVNKESKSAEELWTFTKRENFKKPDTKGLWVEWDDDLFQTSANKPPSREVFYFMSPNQDGSFNDADRYSTYTAGKTIYKFSTLSGNKAEFKIDSREDSVRLALSYPDRNISPACEIETSSGNKSRIINVRAGEAVLNGQKWKVTKKAIIRYEH